VIGGIHNIKLRYREQKVKFILLNP
jgi:hypothetical protein